MNIQIQFTGKDLLNGLDGLKSSVREALSNSGCKLYNVGRDTWKRSTATQSVLSKGRNGKEWFSFDKKTWYWTNKWRTPNPVWAGRNFLKNKRKQANVVMGKVLGQKKQQELNNAIDFAIGRFK